MSTRRHGMQLRRPIQRGGTAQAGAKLDGNASFPSLSLEVSKRALVFLVLEGLGALRARRWNGSGSQRSVPRRRRIERLGEFTTTQMELPRAHALAASESHTNNGKFDGHRKMWMNPYPIYCIRQQPRNLAGATPQTRNGAKIALELAIDSLEELQQERR